MLPSNKKETFHFTYNIEGKYIELTEELSSVFGNMSKRFDNMPYSFADLYVDEEDRENFIEAHKIIDEGEPFATVDFRLKSLARWVRVCLFRMDFTSSNVYGTVQDVSIRYNYVIAETARKEAEINLRMAKEVEALQLVRAVSESSDMMLSVNLTQNIYYLMNYENFQSIKPADEGSVDQLISVATKTIPDEWKVEFLNNFSKDKILGAYNRGDKYIYLEHQQYGGDNELHWVSTHIMFTENPHADDILCICVCRNIDARRIKEEKQKQMLTDALLLAEKANEAKSDFLSRMSHDIRTPMNAIIGMATIAAANIDNKEKVGECLNKIGLSSRFLLGLINDILDLSKIESGKMSINRELFNIKDMLTVLSNAAKDMADSKNQKFSCNISDEIDDFYIGDRVRLEQIFMNLLSNANKYTEEGGRFGIKVTKIHRKIGMDMLKFVIEDTGCGISEEFIDELFNPFSQENDTKRSGTGLGLAIVQNLVHIMNGTVRVQTKVNEGSKFIVEIPLFIVSKEEEQEIINNPFFDKDGNVVSGHMNQIFENKGTTEKITFQGQRVLLVEDNEFNQEIAKTIMEMHDLVVDVASDGYEALDYFNNSEKGHYVIIFMDIQMPGISGYETTMRIRNSEHPDGKTIPIYAMTANAFLTDVDKARQSGMNGHIAKPVDFDVVAKVLLETINKDS